MPKEINPKIERLVYLLEGKYTIPGTNRTFGIDALLGLVPVVGDFLGSVLGLAVLFEAWRHKVPYLVIGRMALNLWLDGALGSVPVVGDLFDFYFKANRRNLRLLQKYAA
jgi:hypothetical protein